MTASDMHAHRPTHLPHLGTDAVGQPVRSRADSCGSPCVHTVSTTAEPASRTDRMSSSRARADRTAAVHRSQHRGPTSANRELSTESTDATTTYYSISIVRQTPQKSPQRPVLWTTSAARARPASRATGIAWQDSYPSGCPSSKRRRHVKFRVDRDVLADAVAWAARSLPDRPSVPVLAGLLIETADGRPHPVRHSTTRSSTRADAPGRGERPRSRAGLRPAARRHRRGAARPARRRLARRHQGPGRPAAAPGSPCRRMPVEEYPHAARDADGLRHDQGRRLRRRPSPRPAPPRAATTCCPVLTGVRLEIEGTTISLMATDRFRLSLRELAWYPEPADLSAQALVPARVLAETARSLTSGGDVTIALSSGEPATG